MMRRLPTEFRQFILRGNVVDLAVGIVIGVAFTGVVQGLVRDLINPIIAMLFGKPDFSKFHFTINHAIFAYGDFINRVITLLIIGAAVFFLVIKPVNLMIDRFRLSPASPSRRRRPAPTASPTSRPRPAGALTAPANCPRPAVKRHRRPHK
jgi:large conductance mechanosensitive channel